MTQTHSSDKLKTLPSNMPFPTSKCQLPSIKEVQLENSDHRKSPQLNRSSGPKHQQASKEERYFLQIIILIRRIRPYLVNLCIRLFLIMRPLPRSGLCCRKYEAWSHPTRMQCVMDRWAAGPKDQSQNNIVQ